MAQAIGSYGERFTAVDRQFQAVDARFNVQTVLMTVLGILVLFGDSIRGALGI